jgi:hypothetical protein
VLAGRTAFALWTAWHYGGEEPFRLYRMLDENYRPIWNPALEPEFPRHPQRVRHFIYGLGRASAIIEGKMEDKMPLRGGRASAGRGPVEKGVIYGPDGEVLSRV